MFKAITIVAALALAVSAAPALADSPQYLINGCQSALGLQPKIVRKEAVSAIGKTARVSVVPFCMGIDFQDFGNAAGLSKTIAANPVLANALARSGFLPSEVTSIVISGDSVQLYVHRD